MEILRKLGLKKGDSKDSESRKRLQKELFTFQEGLEYGFPHKPTAFAYDPSLGFLAIGTSSGSLIVYGRPGVQFTGQHSDSLSVSKIAFLPEQARLVTLCSDGSLHLWEMNSGKPIIEETKQFKLDASKAKNVSSFCIPSSGDEILLGTDAGTVFVLDSVAFQLTNKAFTHDILLEKASDELKANPGSVEIILQHPSFKDKFLVGFGRGLLVLLDFSTSVIDQSYNISQQLESVSFRGNGEEFVTAHSDGSYAVWKTNDGNPPKENVTTPYGPFPCKQITKIEDKSLENNLFLIFSGGMPRASFGDKHTVTVMHGDKHVVFDLTSKVVDFLTIPTADKEHAGEGKIQTLIILTEEEIVSIDLVTEGWPAQQLPYLANIHTSAITSMLHMEAVPEALWNKLSSVGSSLFAGYSTKPVLINGGKVVDSESFEKELLLTGHEDGSVLFWNISGPHIHLVYKLNSADYFVTEDHPIPTADSSEESWPPFRKVGTYELFADSPRLGIQKIAFCPQTETLVIAGSAGQVIVLKLQLESVEKELKATSVNLLEQNSSWQGLEAMAVKSEAVKLAPGFHPTSILQMHPPALSSALDLNTEWKLIAVGSAFGFLVYDYAVNKTLFTKGSQVQTGKAGVSRSRSFQFSIRDSIRHLRKRSSTSESKDVKVKNEGAAENEHLDETKKSEEKTEVEQKKEGTEAAAQPEPEVAVGEPAADDKAKEIQAGTEEAKTEEKPDVVAVENKPEDAKGIETSDEKKPDVTETDSKDEKPEATESGETAATEKVKTEAEGEGHTGTQSNLDDKMREHSVTFAPSSPTKNQEGSGDVGDTSLLCGIRCLYFAQTYITSAQSHSSTLWVGTSGGQIFIYQITFPAADKQSEEEVQFTLVKEIHLRHRAPVVAIFVLDHDGRPLPSSLEAQHGDTKAADMTGGHRVLVCSQEQLKIFSLPSLKAYNKYKVAVHHNDAKICQVAFANFTSKSDKEYKEKDLVCLTSPGEVAIFTVPALRLQMKNQLPAHDSTLVRSSSLLAQNGFGFFQPTSSQLKKFSLCAANHAQLNFALELKEGMRPVETKVEEVKKEEEKTEEVVTKTEQEEDKNEKKEEQVEATKTTEAEPVAEKLTNGSGEGVIPVSVCHSTDKDFNDSLGLADMTADSIKVHFTEESSSTVITCHDIIENKMVVKTTERTVSDAEGTRTETKTVVEEKSCSTESSIQEGTPVVTVGSQ